MFAPIHISNVAFYDVSSASVSKIGFVFGDEVVGVNSDNDDSKENLNNSKKTKKRFIKSLKKEIN